MKALILQDDNTEFAKIMFFVFDRVKNIDRVENIVEKGENAGYQHFLFFPTMFSKGFLLKVVKSRDCMVNNLRLQNYQVFKQRGPPGSKRLTVTMVFNAILILFFSFFSCGSQYTYPCFPGVSLHQYIKQWAAFPHNNY